MGRARRFNGLAVAAAVSVLAVAVLVGCGGKGAKDKPSSAAEAPKEAAVAAEAEPAAAPETADASPEAGARLVGTWWRGQRTDDGGAGNGDCWQWTFSEDGTGFFNKYCGDGRFDYSVVGNRINFRNGMGWTGGGLEVSKPIKIKWMFIGGYGDDDNDSVNVENGYLDFSLSDNGKTLVLRGKRYIKDDIGCECFD